MKSKKEILKAIEATERQKGITPKFNKRYEGAIDTLKWVVE